MGFGASLALGAILLAAFICAPARAQNASSSDAGFLVSKTEVAYSVDAEKTLSFTIQNISEISLRFSLSDDYVHSMVLAMFDESDMPVPMQPDVITRRNDPVSYRSFMLKPRETFTFTVNLDDYFVISKSGIYKLQARFYPAFYDDVNQRYALSNMLLVPVNNFTENEEAFAGLEGPEQSTAAAQSQPNSPDASVLHMLRAIQNSSWEDAFKYIDVRNLYTNTAVSSEVFGTFSAGKQAQELVNFKNRIMRGSSNTVDLSAPDYFSIEDTYYTRTNAKVTALLYTLQNSVASIKRYVFYLHKINAAWQMVDFTSRVVGTTPKDSVLKNVSGSQIYAKSGLVGSGTMSAAGRFAESFMGSVGGGLGSGGSIPKNTSERPQEDDYADPDTIALRSELTQELLNKRR